jgi:glycosyltransferase involved in cell wall biosynthesis
MWKHIEGEYKLPQNKQVAFIPNAYERKFCQYYPDAYKSVENRFNICYIGGITKNRGIEILVEACEKLHQRYPNLKLYLYGSYSARFPSDLRERMESSDFIIRRVVLRRDIHESLLCMDLLVMPYNPKDNYMNLSSPTKFFEYIGTGIPILCTRCESLLEIGNQGGIIYFDYSAADLESKIEMLIDNPSVREELSEKIMEIRADHTWDRRAKVLYESIKSL